MAKDIGVGVIGLGMGVSMFPLNHDDRSRLVVRGVCSARSAPAARPLLEPYGIEHYTNDYADLIARKDIEIISVYSPDKLHFEHCRAALRAGKHVVCTKPITETSQEAFELAALAATKGLKVLVGQTLRFERQSMGLRKLFDEGQLGDVIFVESHYLHDMREMYRITPWRLEKNWLIGAGCHPIDAVRWFLGDPAEVHAYANRGGVSDYRGNDNFMISMRTGEGRIGRVLLLIGCIHSPEPMQKLSVFGTRGTATSTFTDNEGGKLEFVYDGIETLPAARMDFPSGTDVDRYGHTQTVLRYMSYFERCLIEDREPSPNAFDGAKTVLVAEAALESICKDKPVKPDYPVAGY